MLVGPNQLEYRRLKAAEAKKAKAAEEAAEVERKSRAGYVYIIHCVGFPYYKIGHSAMPTARMKECQTGVPFELALEYACEVKDVNDAEYKIHEQYKGKCIRGEWYMFTDQELEAAKNSIVLLKDYTDRPKGI